MFESRIELYVSKEFFRFPQVGEREFSEKSNFRSPHPMPNRYFSVGWLDLNFDFNPIRVGVDATPPKDVFFSYQKRKTGMPRGSPLLITHFGLEKFWRKFWRIFFSLAAYFGPISTRIRDKNLYTGGWMTPPPYLDDRVPKMLGT